MSLKARLLRHDQTDAERRLWGHLRNRELGGFKFRRQFTIAPYIVDFACPQARVVVEIDGGQHAINEVRDDKRTRFLEGRGYRVVRYWNNEVLLKTNEVLEAILSELQRPSP
jgi:very-short-patch-repair endonuclease